MTVERLEPPAVTQVPEHAAHAMQPPPSASPDAADRQWGLAAHLLAFGTAVFPLGNILGPLLLWQLKKDRPFVVEHARESLNFQISVMIYATVCAVLTLVLIGFVMLAALVIFELVVVIRAAMAANSGQSYRYPLCLRLVR